MAKIKFDSNNQVNDFTIVLAYKNNKKIGLLNTVTSVVYKDSLFTANEINFKLYKEINTQKCPLWNDIDSYKSIYVVETNEYFDVSVREVDDHDGYKIVTGISRAESELGQIYLDGIEINTEKDISREDYKEPTIIYSSEKPECSLLHRVLEKVPNYTLAHVDASIARIQRTFSISNRTIYDFLTGELSEELECLFTFDSANRRISVYDLKNNCRDCYERGDFTSECSKCGSEHIQNGYGENTTVFVSTKNFADNIELDNNKNELKNIMKMSAGDDLMTASVANINPNGSLYITYISDEMKKNMSSELVDKINDYDDLYESYTEQYAELSNNIYEAVDQVLYLTSGMMPTVEMAESNSSTEAKKITVGNLSPVGLLSVTSSTSVSTVNSALLNYIKVYIKNAYFKVSVNTGTFSYKGKDATGYYYGTWTGNFKVENRNDENDVVISNTISIKIHDNYEVFLNQKIEKIISKEDVDDGSIYNVLSIKALNDFKSALKLYCLNRLTSFYDAIQTVLDIMIEQDQASTSADFYKDLYVPYKNKLKACQAEIDIRAEQIDTQNQLLEGYYATRKEIQELLNFKTYLGTELYNEFCSYRREGTYENSNYISDGLDNSQLLEKAQEFFQAAKKESVKAGTLQNKITSSLNNLLQIKDFRPLVNCFSVGNWIRVKSYEKIYKLRLINYEIDFDSKNLNVEFSDVIKQYGCESDIKSILDSAKSMATSYSYVAKQAEQGEKAQSSFDQIVQNGLNAALYKLKSNDDEVVVVDNHGITGKSYDDITDSYSDEQIKITHNVLAFTEDNWNTTSLALGKSKYKFFNNDIIEERQGYGLIAKFVNSGYVYGSQLIGGDIYSSNYTANVGTHIGLNDGTFSFAGGNLKYDGSALNVSGKLNAGSGSKIGGFTTTSSAIYNAKSSLTEDVDGVYIGTNGISVGKASTFKVTKNGAVTASKLTVTGGNIANFTISGGYLHNGIKIGTKKSCGMSCGTSLGGKDDWIFWAGNGVFRVDINGKLITSDIQINGGSITLYSVSTTANTISVEYMDSDTNKYFSTINGYAMSQKNLQEKIRSVYRPDGFSCQDGTDNSGYVMRSDLTQDFLRFYNKSGKRIFNVSTSTSETPTIFLSNSSGVTRTQLQHNGTYTSDASGNMQSYYLTDKARVNGDFSVTGTKSRITNTENFGNKLLYCYEMSSPIFGDMGRATLDDTGICYICLDDIFLEAVNSNCDYEVFLQKYGSGDLWVEEITPTYFVVKGASNLTFSWEVKAKQMGYEFDRLETSYEAFEETDTYDYEQEAQVYIQELEKEYLNYEE